MTDFSDYTFQSKAELDALASAINGKVGFTGKMSVARMRALVDSMFAGTDYNTKGLEFTLLDDGTGYSVTGYSGTETDIFIGSLYNGLPILGIGYEKNETGVFQNNKNITSVIVSSHSIMKRIEKMSFYGCSNLKSVILPDSIELIDGNAFNGCSLEKFKFPAALKAINSFSFTSNDFSSVEIPDNVTQLYNGTFYLCSNLSYVSFPKNFKELSGVKNFVDCPSLKEIVLPAGMKKIGSETFSAELERIYCEFPEGTVAGAPWGAVNAEVYYGGSTEGLIYEEVEGGLAVAGYKGTGTDIIIGGHYGGVPIVEIKDGAFATLGNTNITEIDSVTISGKIKRIGNNAFEGSTINSVNIGDGVKEIGECAFWGCGLNSITIPDSVTLVLNGAFASCAGLTSATVGAGCKNMPAAVFSGCEALVSITARYADNVVTKAPWGAVNAEVTYDTEYGTYGLVYEAVDEGAHGNPESYKVTGFNYDEQLSSKTVFVPAIHNGKPVSVGNSAFAYNSNITSVEFAEGITDIGEYLFQSSTVEGVTLPSTVTKISKGMFTDTQYLKSFVVPNTINRIEDYAFHGSYIESVTLPTVDEGGDIRYIGNYAFGYCLQLRQIFLPKSISQEALQPNIFGKDENATCLTIYVEWFFYWDSRNDNSPWGANIDTSIHYNADGLPR